MVMGRNSGRMGVEPIHPEFQTPYVTVQPKIGVCVITFE